MHCDHEQRDLLQRRSFGLQMVGRTTGITDS